MRAIKRHLFIPVLMIFATFCYAVTAIIAGSQAAEVIGIGYIAVIVTCSLGLTWLRGL